MTLSPDDPRLTAFALGELQGDEHDAVAAAVQADPALQAVVAEVRNLAGELEAALATEDLETPETAALESAPEPRRKIVRFPYYWITGLAAAGFAVLVAVRDDHSPVREQRRVYEIDLQSTPVAPTDKDAAAARAPVEPAMTAPPEPAAGLATDARPAPERHGVTLPPPPEFTEQIEPVTLPLAQTKPLAPGALPQRLAPPDAAASPPAEPPTFVKAAAETEVDARAAAVQRERQERAARWGRVRAQLSDTDAGVVQLSAFEVHSADLSQLPPAGRPQLDAEQYAPIDESGFLPVDGNPLSTFAVDVDTGSYANVRRMIEQGRTPPADAVRIEELINYFPYAYAAPAAGSELPFAAHLEVASAPWAPEHRLVRIGLKGRELAPNERGSANLVFLLDVSGSMSSPNKLPLVKEAMRRLIGRLQADDRVAIVTYAGSSGLALPSTPVKRSREILAALDALSPGGSTNGAMGIHLAYDVAKANFVTGGINRVVLCTDGDFNVGVTGPGELGRLVGEKARNGVFLTALGFGQGNYRDDTLERLADRGNGLYGYIDSLQEAQKLLVEQVDGTLATIAKDVKVQVEFNPARVQAYRLIGYENRRLRKEDFNDDAVDAGEIGAGHTVTALYEVIPTGVAWAPVASVDTLKYQRVGNGRDTAAARGGREAKSETRDATELLTVKLRYKSPDGDVSRRVEFPLVDGGASFAEASPDFRFAAAVAGFGMVMRDSPHRGSATLAHVLDWAQAAMASDAGGYRREFVDLVRQAAAKFGP